ncbi:MULTISPECIES: hypothetical protein [unclassified Streptomyces]|uniref:hypothetical protein n=1 Tax=unclassified Streptomyces TaxID=2593676 RepID=UPI002257BF32|nr:MULTISPECIES: hypothetical protein [unclassified Streptomyces]WSP54517.1 hypothetical protein OG306_09095 [Streptomyces sp. NBC_01241]WSU24806.1 hypothetical protein OG508_30250 [Streptomyces sp. NBC_01108]MCX4786056.1 hypothetical protein [Streptomyces sp. NBC_01221]MCX4798087.1 hypothetical protein [Streptomyces sp. NBC_01242]WSJ39340.1 hypothetical protein OG772_27260 [Streptomyces sp. NBC_01321]
MSLAARVNRRSAACTPPPSPDVEEAATAGAHAAQDATRRLRTRLLHHVADLVEPDADRLCALPTADTGKGRTDTRTPVAGASGTFPPHRRTGDRRERDQPVPRPVTSP